MAIKAKILPYNPFDPVPAYCRFDPVDTDSQPVALTAVGEMDDGELRSSDSFTLLVDHSIFLWCPEQAGFGEGQRFHEVRRKEAGWTFGRIPPSEKCFPPQTARR